MAKGSSLGKIRLAVIIVFVGYLLQIASPLRLVNDGIDYLLQASSAADGNGYLVHGQQSMRPPGYPFLIFALIKTGLGKPWAIIALNCLLLALGCIASYLVSRDAFGLGPEASGVICLLTLLSFVMIRQVTQPLSDICFFGTSTACLLLLLRAESNGPHKFLFLSLAAVLMGFCVELRTIGLTLVPAFIWVLIGGTAAVVNLSRWIPRHRIVSIVASVLVAGVLVDLGMAFLHSRYFEFNQQIIAHRGVAGNLLSNLKDHTQEWGEMTVNAPVSKLPRGLVLPVRGLGLVALLICAAGLWGRKKLDAVAGYVLGFSCMVLAYPWFDTRLWLPLVPLLMNYVLIGWKRLVNPRILQPIIVAHCAVFLLLGVVAMGYSTRLTFAGPKRFPDLYGDGRLTMAYRVALQGEEIANPSDVDPDAIYLLRRYK